MKSFIPNEAAGFVQEHKNYRRYAAVLVCLAVVVALATMFGLRLHGRAMTKEVRVFDCAVEPHQHTEDCYVEVDGQKVLNCGQADFMVHSHNFDCYDPDTGELVCQLPEIKEHEHTAECGQTTRELTCGKTEAPAHTHTPDCLTATRTLTCGLEEAPAHTHTDACYTAGEPVLVCGLEEHTHTEACYDETGAQICALEEHTHSDACYASEQVLTCGQTETAGHTHTDACYTTEEALTCGLEEGEGHTHTDDCYTETTTLSCELPEVKLHTHSDDCWTPLAELEDMTDDELAELDLTADDLPALRTREVTDEATGETTTEALTCGQLEVLEHTHTEADGCYHYETVEVAEDEEKDETAPDGEAETGEPLCGLEEHTHTDACYDENGELICGLEEHTHTEECYAPADETDGAAGDEAAATPETAAPETVPVLSCGLEEHTHTDACYSDEKLLVCGLEEGENHTHDDSCYFTERVLSCGKPEHTHTAECYTEEYLAGSCYDINGKLICGKQEHTHTAECYAPQMVLTCELEESPGHTHTEDCYDEAGELICGLEESEPHTHTEDCYEERLMPVCGLEQHTHIAPAGMQFKVSQQVGDLLVTATYGFDANIPADAEFQVEEIAPQSEQDAEFDQYTDKAFDAVRGSSGEDIQVNPVALLSIGFYLPDGVEVEPEGTVNISVQFLNAEDNGVAEGDGVSVVHFADDDTTEVLTGTDVDGEAATSFDTNSFSKFYVTTTNGAAYNLMAAGGSSKGSGSTSNGVNFEHNKRIDYLGDNRDNNKNNLDTALDNPTQSGGLTVTDDLYRLYLDMTGKSDPIDLVIVIDRSNSMSKKMNGTTRWETVYNILEGTQKDGSDGLLYQFLKVNEGKNNPAEMNFVSVVWFAGEYKSRSNNAYGSNTYKIGPNKAEEGGTVLNWTSSYTHQGDANYKISPYSGDDVACTNYVAGLYQADQKLHNLPTGTENHRKVVVFMSDGIPVYYYMAKDMNWSNPDGMYRYGGGNEELTYKDWSGSSLIKTYIGHSPAKSFYESPYFNETLKIFNGASNSFMSRNPNISFHTVAIDLNTQINGWDRTTLLKDMAASYTGGTMFSATNTEGLKAYLQSIMFPSGVTITDDLSTYVDLYKSKPDIKVTATPKAGGKEIVLWSSTGELKVNKNNKITSGRVNEDKESNKVDDTRAIDIIDSVTYDASERVISVKFKKDYCLSKDYTYTLSFNVQLTDAAYNEYANTNGQYSVSGDKNTDYLGTGNNTSSVKGGLRSNDRAYVQYTIVDKGPGSEENAKGTLEYPHPVVQVWGTRFKIYKQDTNKKPLDDMEFRLLKVNEGGRNTPVTPPGAVTSTDGFYRTSGGGYLDFGVLELGDYILEERIQKGYIGYTHGEDTIRTIATFTIYHGRIIEKDIEDTDPADGVQPAPGITVDWKTESGSYQKDAENCKPGTTYLDGTAALTITNQPDGNELQLYKVGEDGETLAGASFTLIDRDGYVYVDGKTPTDAAGLIYRGYLKADVYKLQELTAPNGYVSLKDPIYLKISNDGVELVKDFDGNPLDPKPGNITVETVEKKDDAGKVVLDKKGQPVMVYKVSIKNTLKTVKMQIKKVDSFNNTNVLAGAEFELYKADKDWNRVNEDGKAPAEGDATPMWRGESGEDGLLGTKDNPFPQLKAGKEQVSYYVLVETKAPEGYLILHDDIRIEVKLEKNQDDGKYELNVYYQLPNVANKEHAVAKAGPDENEVLTYELIIPNSSGAELPKTGGIGTKWFTLGGLALMAIALTAGILAGRKRRKA